MSARPVRFGAFEFDSAERRLTSGGKPVNLGSRALDVLATFVERPGQLVTKEELLARVWPKLIVEENNLQVQISALRKVLTSNAIETVPGTGYRFLANVIAPRERAKHNLPAPLSTFIGRAQDVAALRERLHASALVTIVGVGGLGKSRVALHAAQAIVDDYADGVCWVDLSPVADSATVPHAVAAALEVQESNSVVDAITGHVTGRELLLVVDNCEHVLHACANLAHHLLRRAPNLSILATSREALRVTGESVYPLPSLALPEASARSVDEVISCESARLFVERASAANPSFRLVNGDALQLSQICRRLDGIPLALELAAARVRVLSLRSIEERLASRFALLTGGDRTALPRQRTLRAMIDWSHELLSSEEKTLLARLSVFAGGCALEDAESVVAGGPIAPADVLELMSHLVEKSLVVHDMAAGRYRLLESVREYAQERSAQSGEDAVVRNRHLVHFLAFAHRAEPELRGVDRPAWIARLSTERDNFLAAHVWCGRSGLAEDGMLLLDALRMWLYATSIELGTRIARDTLAWSGAQERTRARCLAVYAAASIEYFAGRYAEAAAHGEECLSIAEEIGDEGKAVDGLIMIAIASTGGSDRSAARPALVEALRRARALDDPNRISDALVNLGEVYTLDDEMALAIPVYEQAIAIARGLGNRHSVAINLCNLARNLVMCGAAKKAMPLLIEAASLVDPAMPDQAMQLLFAARAGIAAAAGDWPLAARFCGVADADLERRSAIREPCDEHFLQPLVLRVREHMDAAAFERATAAGRALSYSDAVADVCR